MVVTMEGMDGVSRTISLIPNTPSSSPSSIISRVPSGLPNSIKLEGTETDHTLQLMSYN